MAGPTVLTLEHPAEDAVRAKADHEGKDEKAHDLEEHHADALVTAGKAANERQGDQAEHIVDERGGQDRVADLGLELFISLSVSTVMLTDVAVRMVPMKMFR